MVIDISIEKIEEREKMLEKKLTDSLDAEIQNLISERETARNNKEWDKADKIREELAKRGIKIKDTKEGVVIEKITT